MGILLVVLGVLLGVVAFLALGIAPAITQQLFAGEIAICAATLFTGGAIVMAVDSLKVKPEPPKA